MVADPYIFGQIAAANALSNVYAMGGVLCGGHTVVDKEIKYGLSVTGIVHPDKAARRRHDYRRV